MELDCPLEASRIIGDAYAWEKQWEKALEAYDRHLPAMVADADKSGHIPLLVGRVDSRMELKKETKASVPEMVASAKQAVQLAEKYALSEEIRANAYRAWGEAYKNSAELSESRDDRLEAIDKYTKAAELVPSDPRRWMWHREATNQYLWLLSKAKTNEDKASYYKSGQEQLDKALDSCPSKERDGLNMYQQLLKRLGPQD